MEEQLIAPCGMNCGLCVSYLAMKNDLKNKGFSKRYCAGCLPRGKNCTFMRKHCGLLGKGLVRFCYECEDFPCRRLKDIDKRYRTKYHMSMIKNLKLIKEHGIDQFLKKEAAAMLGISKNYAYYLVKMGEIPSIRFINGRILIPRAALEKMLEKVGM